MIAPMTLSQQDQLVLAMLRKAAEKYAPTADWNFVEAQVVAAGGVQNVQGYAKEIAARVARLAKADGYLMGMPFNPQPEVEVEYETEDEGEVESEAPTEETPDSPLVKALTEVLADAVVFYFQAHGAHWNVRGGDFSQYHALYAAIYEDVYGSIDPIAENIRKIGGFAPFSLRDMALMTSIPEMNTSDDPMSLSAALLASNLQMIVCLQEAFDAATEENQQGIANFIAERIDAHQKWSWQLRMSIDSVGKAAAMKTEDGQQYPAAAFAYVPDPEMPSTWKLRLWDSPDAKETRRQVGMAVAAMGKGFRGNKVQIPSEDMGSVKAKVKAAWKKVNPDLTDDDMPAILKG